MIIVSAQTSKDSLALWEIDCSLSNSIPIVGVDVGQNSEGIIPTNLEGKMTTYGWEWFAAFFNGLLETEKSTHNQTFMRDSCSSPLKSTLARGNNMKFIIFIFLLIFVVPCLSYAQEKNDQTKMVTSNNPDVESERKLAAIKIFMKNGKFIPSYKNYLKNNMDYEKGFDEGMYFMTAPFAAKGTDSFLKNKLKEVSAKSREYACGFFSALESYYAISSYMYYENLEKP